MRFLTVLFTVALFSCKKEECQKSIFAPVGFISCDVSKCKEMKEVEIEGQTVCACLTSYLANELADNERPDVSQKKQAAISFAESIENDSLRLEKLAIYTAFDFYIDCSRF